MREMRSRFRWAPVLGLLAALALAGCSEAPTAIEPPVDGGLDALLAEAGGSRTTDAQGPLLGRLLAIAVTHLKEESGQEAGLKVREQLAPFFQAVQDARDAKDREAYQKAIEALDTQKARIVIRVLGPNVVRRVMNYADDRVHQAVSRIRAALADGQEVGDDVKARVRSAYRSFVEAQSAVKAPDLPAALRLAAQAVDLLGG